MSDLEGDAGPLRHCRIRRLLILLRVVPAYRRLLEYARQRLACVCNFDAARMCAFQVFAVTAALADYNALRIAKRCSIVFAAACAGDWSL